MPSRCSLPFIPDKQPMGQQKNKYSLVQHHDSDEEEDLRIAHHTTIAISADNCQKRYMQGSPLKRRSAKVHWVHKPAHPSIPVIAGKHGRKRYLSSDAPFLEWSGAPNRIGYRQQYLDVFMNHAGKLSAWEHFVSLTNLTDNLGMSMHKPLYTAYLCMIREYRHIRMMKRFGRGHFDEGIKSLGLGELALPCLACPQPGINMETEWLDEKEEEGYVILPPELLFDI
ncbi:uncharacterized protein ARMOST_03171 [Armillaria ostoyae]|uniref:CxC2-like cysteine cluster KDZ transposase-associated domain-containing protein n=1 Tax=Armillaria ostoyae TaxID=47428 RepID=A0A284QTQ8_ARMOS|nr:uncharacterized protein ARMOST_03171 [Armillaria ostoyae]